LQDTLASTADDANIWVIGHDRAGDTI